MRTLVALLLAVLGLNMAAGFADASCIQQTLAEQAERADVVAFGRVSGSSFEIHQVLKGQASGTIQVRFGEGGPGVVTSVDYMATNGDHTLYLERDGAAYSTNACSGSHQGVPTAEERAYLGVGEAPVTTSGGAVPAGGVVGSTGLILALSAIAVGAFALFVILRSRRKATV